MMSAGDNRSHCSRQGQHHSENQRREQGVEEREDQAALREDARDSGHASGHHGAGRQCWYVLDPLDQ